jgi:hypothetical protein
MKYFLLLFILGWHGVAGAQKWSFGAAVGGLFRSFADGDSAEGGGDG